MARSVAGDRLRALDVFTRLGECLPIALLGNPIAVGVPDEILVLCRVVDAPQQCLDDCANAAIDRNEAFIFELAERYLEELLAVQIETNSVTRKAGQLSDA